MSAPPTARAALALILALGACGAPQPPPFEAQLAAVNAAPPSLAERGWWRLLAGDDQGALMDFEAAGEAAGEAPLAALGRATLARAQLDPRRAAREAALAASGEGVVARLGAEIYAQVEPKAPRAGWTPLKAQHYTPTISFTPLIDLQRLHLKPPKIQADRVIALGRHFALRPDLTATDLGGLFISIWPLPPGSARLRAEIDGHLTAWRGDRAVIASSLTHLSPPIQVFDAPGEGALVLASASKRAPRLWRIVEPPSAPPLAPPRVPGYAPGASWVAAWMRAQARLAVKDIEGARLALQGAPPLPAFERLRAEILSQDPSAPPRIARDAAWAALEGATAPADRLARGRLALRRGRLEAAEADLKAAAAAPEPSPALEGLARLALQRGDLKLARQWVDQAARRAADPCALLDLRAALTEEGAARAALAQLHRRCGQPLAAATLLLDLHRPQAALEALADLTPQAAGRPKALRLKARALIGLDRLAEAAALLGGVEEAEASLMGADLRGARVDEALTAWAQAHPDSEAALDLVAARLSASPFEGLALDSEAAILAFERCVAAKEAACAGSAAAPVTRVLDHAAQIHLHHGRRLRWVHEILYISSREAAETYGEIGLPEGARRIALYTRKADGRRLDAEESPEKESLSLPDLKVDDYVVAVYIERGDSGGPYDSALLTPRVLFGDLEAPIFHKRVEVYSPDAHAPQVHGPLAGEARLVAHLKAAGLRLERRAIEASLGEPHAPPPAFWIPWARFGRGISLKADLRLSREAVLAQRRRSPHFDAWAKATAGEGSTAARVARLSRAARAQIEDTGGLIDAPVSLALAEGEGSRALILSAALEAIDVPHQLLLARARLHLDEGPFAQVVDYSYPLLETPVGLLDPGPRRAPLGFIPEVFKGGAALILWPHEAPSAAITLPEVTPIGERREVEVNLTWAASGALIGEVTDRLEGQEAILVGGYLADAEVEARPRLLERLLTRAFGAARITAWSIPSEAQPDGPLILKYRFEVQAAPTLDLGLFPVAPGRTYAALTRRALPLWISRSTHQDVRLKLKSDAPFQIDWRPGAWRQGPHRFELTGAVEEDSLEARAQVDIDAGLIPPSGYAAFAEWARRVDRAERIKLKR